MESTKKHYDIGILVLRIGIGLAFALVYGWPKISGGPDFWMMLGKAMGNLGINFAPVVWGFMSSITEFGGGILLIFGLFGRPVAALMAFNMIVAMTQHFIHFDPWNKVIIPIEMFTVFTALLFFGAGRYSLDHLIFRKKIKMKTVDIPDVNKTSKIPLRNTV